MIRGSQSRHSGGYFKQLRSSFGGFLLSSSARNKKYDDKFAFDFSEIFDGMKNRSLEQMLDSKSAPAVLICASLCFIAILYIIIASFSTSYLFNYESQVQSAYDNTLIIEIEEVLSKLMELKKTGNMKEYEEFLQPTMRKYCLGYLGKSYLSVEALESFHMNLAETVSFISRGGVFTEHQSLMVTSSGGIVDPSNPEDSTQTEAKSCPLLKSLYELGLSKDTNADKAKTSVTSNDENQEENDDSKKRFNQKFSWKNMEEFMNLILKQLTKPGDCTRIAKELPKDNMKSFILNFYEMAEIIGKEIAKEEAAGVENLGLFWPNPNSPDYRKYVIGRDGGVYETDQYDDTIDEYLHCAGIEHILNDKFILDENLTYTNVKIAIDETFDAWYDKLQKTFNDKN